MMPSDQMSVSGDDLADSASGPARHPTPDRWLTLAGILLPLQHLWTRIPRRPAKRLEQPGPARPLARKPEIGELDPAIAVEEYILKLEVAVDRPASVHRPDRNDELAKDAAALALEQPAALDEVVEQLAAAAQLGHEPYVRLGREDFVQVKDVRVVQQAVVVNLARELRGH